MRIFKTLKGKLQISLFGICLIPLLLMSIGSYEYTKNILTENLKKNTENALDNINSEFSSYIQEYTRLVRIASVSNNIDDVMESMQNTNENIINMYYADKEGNISLYPRATLTDDYNVKYSLWYVKALSSQGNVIITKPYLDAVTSKQVITIASTVEKNGVVVGVVGIDCLLDDLSNRVSTNTIGDTGLVYVVDNDGDVISSQNKSEIGKWYTEIEGKYSTTHKNEGTGWDIIVAIDNTELDSKIHEAMTFDIVIMALFFVVASVSSTLLSKRLYRGLGKLKSAIIDVANNDISKFIEVTTNDEIGELEESVNNMIDNLRKFTSLSNNTVTNVEIAITSLQAMYSEVSIATQDVVTAMNDVTNGNLKQLTKTQDSLNELDKFSESTQLLSNDIENITHLLNSTKELSINGKNIVDDLVENTVIATQSSEDINNIMIELSKSMNDIAKVSSMIKEVANRTNLLSLNASIEAARAGEHGKGFSVVATEIKKLAEQSKVSTAEIDSIITKVERNQSRAMELMHTNNKVINEQEHVTKETSSIFNNIQQSVDMNVAKMQDIVKLKDSLNVGKDSLLESINEIANITEVTASSSEEVTASTDEIAQKMEQMIDSMKKLQIVEGSMKEQVTKFKINTL